tara:strand:+ start:78 stop:683 length:606 start_codon:yes stop_codon:yes gene_type:complete
MAMEYDDDNLRNSTIEPNKRKVGGYTYASTGKRYTGKIVEYGGRMFTTKSGTYEGHVSKEVVWTNEVEKLNIVSRRKINSNSYTKPAQTRRGNLLKPQIKATKQLINSRLGTDRTARLPINRDRTNEEMYGKVMNGRRKAIGHGKRYFTPNSFSKSTPNVRKRFNKALNKGRDGGSTSRTLRRGKLKKSTKLGVFRNRWRG